MQATHMHTLTLPPSLPCHQHLDKLSQVVPHKQTQQDRMWLGACGSWEEAQRAVW